MKKPFMSGVWIFSGATHSSPLTIRPPQLPQNYFFSQMLYILNRVKEMTADPWSSTQPLLELVLQHLLV